MSKLIQIEALFQRNRILDPKSPQARMSEQYVKFDTADFPMKLVTRGLLDE